MDASARGMELFQAKGRDVPLVALRYVKALIAQVGGCGEVILTAFCWYAEKEEKCPPSSDEAYRVNDDDSIAAAVIAEARTTSWQPEWWADLARVGADSPDAAAEGDSATQ